jgi:hypothetical protein
MQACGVAGLFSCVVCMLLLFLGWQFAGKILFLISLLLLLGSLGWSLEFRPTSQLKQYKKTKITKNY